MSELDDVVQAFAPQTEEQKQASFEASTIRLVLAQLGFTSREIDIYSQKEAFTVDWFNDNSFMAPALVVQRIFDFNFTELLAATPKHPIVTAWKEISEYYIGSHFCWVFKVSGDSRMVATNVDVDDRSHLRVIVGDTKFSVVPFNKFFARYREF